MQLEQKAEMSKGKGRCKWQHGRQSWSDPHRERQSCFWNVTISIVGLRGTKSWNLSPPVACTTFQVPALFCRRAPAFRWSLLKAQIARETHQSLPIYKMSNHTICEARILFSGSEIKAQDKHTWRPIKCLFGIWVALENLPCIDAVAV